MLEHCVLGLCPKPTPAQTNSSRLAIAHPVPPCALSPHSAVSARTTSAPTSKPARPTATSGVLSKVSQSRRKTRLLAPKTRPPPCDSLTNLIKRQPTARPSLPAHRQASGCLADAHPVAPMRFGSVQRRVRPRQQLVDLDCRASAVKQTDAHRHFQRRSAFAQRYPGAVDDLA